jgi:LysM repeat protein
MKVTLIFAMLGLGFALPVASAASELETLRARCAKQEQQIARLKEENLKLRALAPEPPAANSPKSALAEPSPLAGKTHKISGNETFSSIARKYRVSVESLIAANPETKPTALRPGQVIRLSAKEADPAPPKPSKPETQVDPPAKPDKAENSTTPETSEPPAKPEAPADPAPATTKPKSTGPSRPETTTASTEPDPPAKADKKTRSVTIDREMTYGEFATKHGTSTQRLNALNGLDLPKSTVLAKGSELYVPGQP